MKVLMLVFLSMNAYADSGFGDISAPMRIQPMTPSVDVQPQVIYPTTIQSWGNGQTTTNYSNGQQLRCRTTNITSGTVMQNCD